MDIQQNPVLVSVPNYRTNSLFYPTVTMPQSFSSSITPTLNIPTIVNPLNNQIMPLTYDQNYADVSNKAKIIAEIENEINRLRLLESFLLNSQISNNISTISEPVTCQLNSNQLSSSIFYNTPQLTNNNYLSSKELENKKLLSDDIKEINQPSTSTIEDNDVDRPYKCLECNKKFRFKSNLFEHKSLHLSEQMYQYVCPFCSKICRLKGNLKKHLQTHMTTAEQLEEFWKLKFSRSSGRPRKYIRYDDTNKKDESLSVSPISKNRSTSPEVEKVLIL